MSKRRSWYERAVVIVADALAKLPPDATHKQCADTLRDACPWGPREYWPYTAWRRACREALLNRGMFNASARKIEARREDQNASAQPELFP